MTYGEFLESKIETAPVSGFDIDASDINPALLPHRQKPDERLTRE